MGVRLGLQVFGLRCLKRFRRGDPEFARLRLQGLRV